MTSPWFGLMLGNQTFSFGQESCSDERRTRKTHCRVLKRFKFLFTFTLVIQSSKRKWPSYAIDFKLMLSILEQQQVQLHTQSCKTNDIMCNFFLPMWRPKLSYYLIQEVKWFFIYIHWKIRSSLLWFLLGIIWLEGGIWREQNIEEGKFGLSIFKVFCSYE
jgi:hypothetical protein